MHMHRIVHTHVVLYCIVRMCLTSGGDAQEKISTLEILVPQKNKCPRKCNLFWARKVLEKLKYSDHFSGTEYAGNSLYILNIFHFRISVE